MKATNTTIQEIQKKLLSKEFSVTELIEEHLTKIKQYDSGEEGVNAVITLNEENALLEAGQVDDKIKKGESLKMLEGIPVAVKDVLSTKDLRTTAASKILDNYIPVFDATSVRKLKEAGAIIIAKTNCDEFAHGSSGENSAYGPTRNPYDLSRVAGGSSAGSGAILAYDGAVASLGTDTGGSSRAPASFLGLVGLKPTYGRVSRYGLLSMCSSFDTVAPLAKNVTDCATLLSAISSKDPKDSTSSGFEGKDFTVDFNKGIKGLKIAYPKQAIGQGLDERVKAVFFKSLNKLKKEGAAIEEVSMPLFGEPALAAYYIINTSEISSNLSRFDGIRYGMQSKQTKDLKDFYIKTRTAYLGSEAKRRIMLGNFSLSAGYYDAYYNKAQRIRKLLKEEVAKIFSQHNLIITPTMTTPAFKIGAKSDPLSMYLADLYSIYANMVSVCAISLNAGWVDNKPKQGAIIKNNKLPVGIQFMAKWWDEETLLRTAYAFEGL